MCIRDSCRGVQVCRKCRTVKVRAESNVFIGAEAEKVLDVAVELSLIHIFDQNFDRMME